MCVFSGRRTAAVFSALLFCGLSWASLPVLATPAPAPASAPAGAKLERRLYVGLDGYVGVFDIDAGHKLIKTFDLVGRKPDATPSGVRGAGVFRGVCADAASGRLYFTHNPTDELICFDLVTERIVWRNRYGNHADSQAITPDGKFIYLPCRGDGTWWVIDAATGDAVTKIQTGGAPHNTNCNADGTRMYLETLSHPFVFVADTKTHTIVHKIGPFSDTVRPFSLSDDEKYVFACVNNLLGFEVGDVATKAKLHRVEAKRPAERVRQLPKPGSPHGCPSHGVGMRPGTKEVWVTDSAYGYLYVYDVSSMPPKHVADVPLFDGPGQNPEPGWVCFSIDGKYAYAPGDAVVDADSKKVVARMPTSEKMIEVDFRDGKPVKAGRRMW